MSHLVLTLRPGEMLIVNGARIRSRTRAQLELTTHARFLFGKQIMSAEAARTPARQFYLALQAAYAGSEVERAPGLEKARALAPTLKEAAASAVVCDAVDGALA